MRFGLGKLKEFIIPIKEMVGLFPIIKQFQG